MKFKLILVALLVFIVPACIQWEEGGQNTPEEAVVTYDRIEDEEFYETYEVNDELALVFLKGTNIEEAIWAAEVHFVKDKNLWSVRSITNMQEPSDDFGTFKRMSLSKDEGYSVGYVKGEIEESVNNDLETYHVVKELEEYNGWKIWFKETS
ncbi:hypothetical protein [Guptibacillus algicola]|uniref:hypothetical protein n=1 Tax=Guptibacillus algicola TaxID=225844 RepID=UPI001CD8109F|nr:hypothetical protein [Alkalihalobacillus algicola]MCA0987562.1 hypothetical protein [Alkalihalobacillus algicola]